MFNYGGSSFAIIYEKLPNKELIFVNDSGVPYPQRPVLPIDYPSPWLGVTDYREGPASYDMKL